MTEKKKVTFVVNNEGLTSTIYDEKVENFDFEAIGEYRIARAGRVEPDANNNFYVDLSIVDPTAPQLGPFRTKTEAVAAEVAYIEGLLAQGKILPQKPLE